MKEKVNEGIFKAYDIRGIYPDEINENTAYLLGRAFAVFADSDTILVGRDMRTSGKSLVNEFARGVVDQGKTIIKLGLISTDALYFAAGKLDAPGAMFTASHNPPEYNGIKFCKAGAEPVSDETGLNDIRDMVLKNDFPEAKNKGKQEEKDILPDYVKHVLSFVEEKKLGNLKIVIDAGNGMAGKLAPMVFDKTPCEIIPMYFELDGTFPNHEANPIKPENVQDLITKVKEEGADLGLAFDGDADRVFFIDDQGNRVSSSLITAMVADQVLEKNPGASIIYNVPSSKIVPEIIEKKGGIAILERVGHSFIKETMKEKNSIFGGEHSGHFYFRDNYRADSGLIAALIVIEIISQAKAKFSELLAPYAKYNAIEETNFEVSDKEKALAALKEKYSNARIEEIDGITFHYDDFWFNVRPSNTEPVIRLNLEANTEELMNEKTKEISGFLTSV
ncbi:phosphomannomutase/phosphoglucomutase [Patescibacteria group bacterium]|nr:phosphomannomutase/phosphoglucomutase [Patescibacteria group bacterium]MBU1673975.1 phosphomannomutase/phosphoglucomutase [Patescibacteria group bacterium]MBU1962951.1 phosphomannomutase/phosphoglucomutase [Patescibacteria group bacterium]